MPNSAVLYDDEEHDSKHGTTRALSPSAPDEGHSEGAVNGVEQDVDGAVRSTAAKLVDQGDTDPPGMRAGSRAQLPDGADVSVRPEASLLASDTDTAHLSPPLAGQGLGVAAAEALPLADHAPAAGRWGMPSNLPPIPVLNFCMSMGMNARSLKTLRAHLKAKGFAMHPSDVARSSAQQKLTPQPSTQPDSPPASAAHRWHGMQAAHSAAAPLVTPAGDPSPASPRHPPPDLASTSWMGWHDASSQMGPASPRPSGSDVASDDVWRDVIAEDSSEGEGSATSSTRSYLHGQRSEGHISDSSDDRVSSATFKSAASLGTRSHPRSHTGSTSARPPQLDTASAPFSPPSHASRKHTPGSRGTTPGSRGLGGSGGRSQSWAASVHIAQASVAADDLAHTQGGSTHPALDAFRAGRLSFAFSGGGFFFPYHLGCVIALKDMGIITDATPLAGASCGSIIIACVNSGLDLHKLVDRLLEFAEDCRTWGTAGRLRDVIVTFMTANLPPDAHLRCRAKTFISLTKVFPYLHPYIISDYTSKEDLVHAIATSCHIPAYCDGSFMARFRSHWFVDGGLVRHIPALPAEAGAAYVAGVSCVPFKFLESLPGVSRLQLLHSLAVSPDMFGAFPFGWHEIGGLVLAPAEDPVLLQMVEMGKRDVTAWANAVGLIAHLASTRPVPFPLATPPDRPTRRTMSGPDSAGEAAVAHGSGAEVHRTRSKRRHASGRVRSGTPMVSPLPGTGSVPAQPGGLPAAIEDDWHDAVEDQSLISPSSSLGVPSAHTNSSTGESRIPSVATISQAARHDSGGGAGHVLNAHGSGRRGSFELADGAMREGLAAAANAVAGPLHMDAHQAIDALAGTSTLGLAQAAAVAAEGRDHAADRHLQVLRVTGGTYRPGPAAAVVLPVPQPQGLEAHVLPSAGVQTSRGGAAMPQPQGSLESLAAVTSPVREDLGSAGVQAYRLDIDVDASAWAGSGGTAAREPGAAGSGTAGSHTVQVTARIAGQPVMLELRLHMPADANAGR